MLTGLLPRAAAGPPMSLLYQARALHDSYHSSEQFSRKRDSTGSPRARSALMHFFWESYT